MYRLGRPTPHVTAQWDALPAVASEELTLAIADVCDDPYGTTEPRSGHDKDVERILTLQHTTIALLLIDAPPIQRIYVRGITHLG